MATQILHVPHASIVFLRALVEPYNLVLTTHMTLEYADYSFVACILWWLFGVFGCNIDDGFSGWSWYYLWHLQELPQHRTANLYKLELIDFTGCLFHHCIPPLWWLPQSIWTRSKLTSFRDLSFLSSLMHLVYLMSLYSFYILFLATYTPLFSVKKVSHEQNTHKDDLCLL